MSITRLKRSLKLAKAIKVAVKRDTEKNDFTKYKDVVNCFLKFQVDSSNFKR
jgi:hypothetical protein